MPLRWTWYTAYTTRYESHILIVVLLNIHKPLSKPEKNWINCLLFSRWMSAKHQQRTRELQFAGSQRHATFPLVSERELDVFLFWEVESSSRAGFILITGLTLGASHEPMADAMEIIATSKHSRSLYAEAAQDKRLLYNTLRSSLWNAKMDPLVIVFRVAPVQEHDFRQGSVFRLPLPVG